MISYKCRKIIYNFLSLLSVVRGYNILILIAAQYLAAIFIFSPQKSLYGVIFDLHLGYLIFATVCIVAAGYIINNFYDSKLDIINRPFKSKLDNYIKQETKLKLYFFLNFLGFLFGILISIKAALFFSIYIFAIWLYSHKLKKYPFIGLISVTILTISPFLTVFIYFKNFSTIIFIYAIFLFLVIMVRELVKDLENMKGAIANDFITFPVFYGERKTKYLSITLLFITFLPIIILFSYPALGYMRYYFYLAMITILFIVFYFWKASQLYHYRVLHNILKVLLLVGVLWLVFVDTSLIVEKVIERLN